MGKGKRRWQAIRQQVLEYLPGAVEVYTDSVQELHMRLKTLLYGEQPLHLVSAGGDGSIHALANLLLETGTSMKHRIGAIGLGSSNDFLKPFERFIGKIPVRFNNEYKGKLQDAGLVRVVKEDQSVLTKYFIINASIGVTALGNQNFNHPDWLLRYLKRLHTGIAIYYTALSSILRYKNFQVSLGYEGNKQHCLISNINILKSPYVSGSLYYNQQLHPDDGLLGLHICSQMTKMELIRTLMDLEKGRFLPGSKRISAKIEDIQITAPVEFVYECDGETDTANHLEVAVIPGAIQLLTN